MRELNVFGKKNRHIPMIFWMVAIFVVAVGGYFGLSLVQTNSLEELQIRQDALNAQVQLLLEASQEQVFYHTDEIVPYLPTDYQPTVINNEIAVAKALSFEADATISETMSDGSGSPFEESLGTNVVSVAIALTISTDDPGGFIAFLDHLAEFSRFYYVASATVSFNDDGSGVIHCTLYTFYYDTSA